ncbi:MAG: dihydrofolate reductase, partial [Chitinophagaceae bacterium]
MIYTHLVAASENNAIGKNNQLLWHLPNDLRYFKNKTWGMPVIMGRKTYESVDKPLPGRTNIVITKQEDWKRDGVIPVKSLEEALEKANETDAKEIFIIGGGEIFKESIEIIKRIYLTRVHANFDGDTFYPEFDKNTWKLVSSDPFPADEKHAYSYTFEIWER